MISLSLCSLWVTAGQLGAKLWPTEPLPCVGDQLIWRRARCYRSYTEKSAARSQLVLHALGSALGSHGRLAMSVRVMGHRLACRSTQSAPFLHPILTHTPSVVRAAPNTQVLQLNHRSESRVSGFCGVVWRCQAGLTGRLGRPSSPVPAANAV